MKNLKFDTRAIHSGQAPDPTTSAIITPVYLSSTYVQSSPGIHKGYEYSRTSNPTRKAYEDCLANLESGKYGFAFASGCAATATLLQLLNTGDHVICCDDLYGGTRRLFNDVFKKNGFQFSFIDFTHADDFQKEIRPNTKMVWIESPTNPLLKLIDIRKITDIAKTKNIISVVDNTFMSPYFQRPLELGADISYHSTSKYISGHSDIIGGAVVTACDQLAEKIAYLSNAIGGIQSPFDSFLCLRSLKTLAVRMRTHNKNAETISKFLNQHSKVEHVIYPGLNSHPHYALAKKQMSGFGGMIGFYIKGGLNTATNFLESLKIFSLAESLGAVESLAEHPGIMTHASIPQEILEKLGINESFIRLSIGIEDQEDLINDLENALTKC